MGDMSERRVLLGPGVDVLRVMGTGREAARMDDNVHNWSNNERQRILGESRSTLVKSGSGSSQPLKREMLKETGK